MPGDYLRPIERLIAMVIGWLGVGTARRLIECGVNTELRRLRMLLDESPDYREIPELGVR